MTSSEKKLARALKDAETVGLSNADVRLIKLRIQTLNDIVQREHDAKLTALEAENERLRDELERLSPKTQGDPVIAEALKKYNEEKREIQLH